MPKVDVLTIEGNKSTALELPGLFATAPKQEILHQAVVAYLANARQGNAHTKTRGEVRGGGRKPWKQKGTGRARAGSSRSPIWVGGGITFGPRNDENHSKRLPVKMKRLALAMALSTKVEAGKLIVVDDLKVAEPKTKLMATVLEKVAPEATSILMVVPAYDATLLQASRNLPNAALVVASDMNAYDVLNFDTIVMTQAAVEATEQVINPAK